MAPNTQNPSQHEFKAEMKQLLHLIIHSLYTHPEVFLRELISNASDALNKVRLRTLQDKNIVDPNAELKIEIHLDSKTKTFTIEDTGIGMTQDELIRNIGTIAKSGTQEFLSQLKDAKEKEREGLIGQFGVGFYSVFMVTDEVTIETRSADPNAKAIRWISQGESSYTVQEIDRKERGTKISFTLKSEHEAFAEDYQVEQVIQKYSNFADFPIYLHNKRVNQVDALWRKNQKDVKESDRNEFYKFITNDHEDPRDYLHVSVEGSVVSFKALLFIPKNAPRDYFQLQEEKGVHLYSNKILIQRDCKDLLPQYLRFIKGVVDTIDLPLNVSREVSQSSPVMIKIREILVSKILAHFEQLATNEEEKYLEIYRNFGPLFKTGLEYDFSHRDKIINLLRFESSKEPKGKYVSLKTYASRLAENQKEIYYISGENREALERNPNLEYFLKNQIEVLYLTDPVDAFLIPTIMEYEKLPLRSTDKAEIDIKKPDIQTQDDSSSLTQGLLSLFKAVLKDDVQDVVVSKRLVDSPVTLVRSKDALDSQMEKMMKMMNKEYASPKKILEVNMDHALVKNLSRKYLANQDEDFIRECIRQLYEGSKLIDGEMSQNQMLELQSRMIQIMQRATS